MNLYQLLNSRTELDCPAIIGDVEMPADICWDENGRVTQEGYLAFRSLMDCEVVYDEEKNFLDIPDGNPTEGERFVYALAGYVGQNITILGSPSMVKTPPASVATVTVTAAYIVSRSAVC